MPELPEVETVRAGLVPAIAGRTIADVVIVDPHGPRALRRHLPGPADFRARLIGRTVVAVRRRGKYLWWALDDGDAVLAHLGMSGQFRVSAGHDAGDGPTPAALGRHARVRVVFAGDTIVDFVDQRTFGSLQMVSGGAGLPGPIAHIARDPLDPDFDRDAVVRAIRVRRSTIKRTLLDQSIVSGIGNIYADETLWAARVHYDRPTASLAPRTVRRILDEARAVMRRALDQGGTSFDALYVNVNGESGYFSRDLNVYGRGGEPCLRCGAPIRREPFMNRSSYFCPRCQRAR